MVTISSQKGDNIVLSVISPVVDRFLQRAAMLALQALY